MCVSETFKRLELLLQIKFCSGQMVQTRGSFSFITQQHGDPADEGRLPACRWSGFLGRLVWLWRGRIARRLFSWETDAKVHGSLRLDLNWGPKFPGQSKQKGQNWKKSMFLGRNGSRQKGRERRRSGFRMFN